MRLIAFFNLCDILRRNNLLQSTKSVNIREQVVIFFHIIGHNVRFRVIESRYYRSTETVHRYFRVVLRAILKLYKVVIRLPDESTPSEIRNNPRFYPYFKNFIRALDGTHVRASVPLSIQGRFRSRKGGTTQNVLADITFDLKFSYVLAGWEGNAHDSRILSDALSRPRGLRIPEGKYYLADAGYGIRNGYIIPYRGVRYHLKEFSAQGPENAKELFNLRHSSLRITIERVFGILKKQFRVLDAEPFWNFQTQVDIVLAAEEAQRGNKHSNTFKAVSINRVAEAIIERFQVQCDAKYVENHLRTVKNQWQIICTIRGESGFGWDDNMKMITCDRATYDAAMMAHKKYEPFLNKSIDHYDEMALVVGKDMATGSFARTFANIDLDDGNQDSVPIDCDNEETEELTGQPLQWSSKRIDCSKPKTVHFAPNSFPTALKQPPPQPAPPANPVSVQAAGNRLSSLSSLVGFPRTLLLLNGLCRCTVDARSSGGLLRWSRRPISGQLLTPSIFFFGALIIFVVDGNGLSRVDGEDLAVLGLSGKPDLRMCGV
ncbi:hypothetical protein PVK06_034743 [Gossypium arboreum]|uniref:Nuclease HARBI1 n=1 Tax=Gossypium arboreum TaxID=29729 RepID=A0ABR0NH83_GOSAR|nr:hypothetical protein PVK06_034743 [Gossypium arboreum]